MDHVWGYVTDRRLREKNEDSLGAFTLPFCTLAIVCDGMGGHAGGAEASAIAVRVIHDTLIELQDLPVPQALTESIQAANQTIYEISRKVRRLLGMGTTVAAVCVVGTQAWVAHVGDSRVYLVRGRSARLLTRDHTMVNLFVDAELLSPEDAHSHPEAHILARSVGVDRNVEVDVQGPIDLLAGDVLVACSDGVHGSLDDDEVGDVDWSSPQRGVEQLLKLVRGRDGDDNATAVAVAVGLTTLERPPPSRLPDPEVLGASVSATGGTELGSVATPVPQAPRPAIRVPSMSGGAFVLDAGPQYGSDLVQFDVPSAPTGTTVVAPGTAPAPAPPPRAAAQRTRRTQVVLLAASAAVAGAAVALAGWMISGAGQADPGAAPQAELTLLGPEAEIPSAGTAATPDPEAATGVADADGSTEVDPSAADPSAPDPSASPDLVEAPLPVVLPGAWRFAPEMPRANRRVPHRPTRYVQPPPGGPLQLEAVLAARNRECRLSLDAVRAAMSESMDYASLYGDAWQCFNDNHQGWLVRADVRSLSDFAAILVHFEGHAATDPAALRIAEWARPARGGIEYRLEAFLNSGEVDLFSDVMLDRLGGPAIAEHLVRDVLLETQAATALAAIPDPDEQVTQWWARRVYMASRAMEGLPGELIAEYRPELWTEVVAQLDLATGGRYSRADAPAEGVPERVREAVDVGRGRLPGPATSAQVAALPRPASPAPRPAPSADPDTEAPPEPVDLRPIIHRGGEDPLPEGLR